MSKRTTRGQVREDIMNNKNHIVASSIANRAKLTHKTMDEDFRFEELFTWMLSGVMGAIVVLCRCLDKLKSQVLSSSKRFSQLKVIQQTFYYTLYCGWNGLNESIHSLSRLSCLINLCLNRGRCHSLIGWQGISLLNTLTAIKRCEPFCKQWVEVSSKHSPPPL
jgi:hypothetical protein